MVPIYYLNRQLRDFIPEENKKRIELIEKK